MTKFLLVVVSVASGFSLRASEEFTVRMKVDCHEVSSNETLYAVGPLKVVLRRAGEDVALRGYDDGLGNYLRYRLKDGSCPVLEATICEKAGRVGVPLGIVGDPNAEHDVRIDFASGHFSIEVDGAYLDEDMPIPASPVVWPKKSDASVLSSRVKDAKFLSPAVKPLPVFRKRPDAKPIVRPIQYWTPDEFNAWVGDVTLGTWKGRLHVFYLHDRRHHGSGANTGRHRFEHISSDDLVHWVEHPTAVPLENEFETCGTGTPFEWNGKYCLAYGLHTTRFVESAKTVQGRKEPPFAYADLAPLLPIGGTYAESEDGIHFRKSGVCITYDQNPSVYNRSDGRFGMGGGQDLFVAHGTDPWNWRKVTNPKTTGGDCPAPFEWNGHHYLLQGFHWFDHSTNGVDYADWTATGDDIYDGLSVPMVASWKGNRRIYAGWLRHPWGWGGWLVFRELIQYPDGRLGMKWIPEIATPGKVRTHEVTDTSRPFTIRFAKGEKEVELKVDPTERRAQLADTSRGQPAPRVRSLRENHETFKPKDARDKLNECMLDGDKPFAIENVRGLDRPYAVRTLVHYDPKANATIIDVEIAGQRTMILRRPGRYEERIRPVYLAEIPLVCSYSNGNCWMGWAGRWTDWPLTVDRTLPYIEGSSYQVSDRDFKRTLEEIRKHDIDGCTFNVQNENLDRIIAGTLAKGEMLPALTVPDLSPRWIFKDKDWYRDAFCNSNGVRMGGKRLVTCYWSYKNTPDELSAKVKDLEKDFGPILFMPDFGLFTNSRWRKKLAEGALTEEDREAAKERLRDCLRYADGARFGFYAGVTDVVDGERSFDADFFRKHTMPLIREVYAEPAFPGKYFGIDIGMGHDNSYIGGLRCSSNGTKTLRDSLTCALELNPDVITFFEWDEWNENTGIRPSLWNSFAPRRIIRAMRAAHEGRVAEPLPGDDLSIPNIVVSFHKTLTLGNVFTVELLAVPDAAASGSATAKLTLRDETGRLLKAFDPVVLDLAKMSERRLKWDTALAGDACAIVPELEVSVNGRSKTWNDGLPFAELRPTANWDRKWVLMPLRDLVDGATCRLASEGRRDTVERVRVSVDSSAEIDRLEVTDGGDIVYSMSGDESQSFREDDDHYVFSSMQFCYNYTKGGAELALTGVDDVEWLQCTKRTRSLSCNIYPRAEFTADAFFRLRKTEAANAVLHLSWPEIGEFEIPICKVLENGSYAVVGTNGLCFSAHRYNRQPAFFAPVAARQASSVADIVPDLPVSVLGAHALTADGKIVRSRPLVVGKKAGVTVPIRVWSELQKKAVTVRVDRARVPDLRFDVSGERSGAIALSGFGRAHDGILGGSTAAATCRNRGDNSRQHCCTEIRKDSPSRAPAVLGAGFSAEMSFDGSGSYLVLPGGTIPTTAGYRLSFEFWPDDLGREQEMFGCGMGELWGTVGYLKLLKDGRVSGIALSVHEYQDSPFVSKNTVVPGQWNTLELISDVETVELVLNGVRAGRVKMVQPGRFDANCWFGGRKGALFKGKIRNVRVIHGINGKDSLQ